MSTRDCLVYLVGEGPGDIGDLALNRLYSDGEDGFMQPILRKLAPKGITLQFDGQKVSRLGTFGARPRLRGRRDRAAKALALATAASADLLVYVIDLDKTQGRRASAGERRKLLREIRGEIEEGFEEARTLDSEAARILCVKAIPIRMIESWALADPAAVEAVAETFDARECRLRPEELWGSQDRLDSRRPKHVLRRALGCEPTRDVLARIAAECDIARLQERCPDSFGAFSRDVSDAISACGA